MGRSPVQTAMAQVAGPVRTAGETATENLSVTGGTNIEKTVTIVPRGWWIVPNVTGTDMSPIRIL
jgi:hypothetical protein